LLDATLVRTVLVSAASGAVGQRVISPAGRPGSVHEHPAGQ